MVNLLCLAVSAGVLLGIAIRTGSPLSLNLAEPVWKQLAGMNLTIADLSEVCIQSFSSLNNGVLGMCAVFPAATVMID